MYIIDFFIKLFRKSNWVVLLYMALNIAVSSLVVTCIDFIFFRLFNPREPFEFLHHFGIIAAVISVIYLIALLIILSPLGEAVVRLKYKCKKIERNDHINFAEGIYHEVFERANAIDSHLKDNARLYITESSETTVFALGRKTLAFTSGIFDFPEEKVKALLARELGHISEKDSDFLLLAMTGGFLVNACIWILRIFLYAILIPVFVIGGIFFVIGLLAALMIKVFTKSGGAPLGCGLEVILKPLPWLAKTTFGLVNRLCKFLTDSWGKLGAAIILKTRRSTEYYADEFAFNCGYGDTLLDIILNDDLADQSEGMFKEIVKAYPPKESRAAKLQDLGAELSSQ